MRGPARGGSRTATAGMAHGPSIRASSELVAQFLHPMAHRRGRAAGLVNVINGDERGLRGRGKHSQLSLSEMDERSQAR